MVVGKRIKELRANAEISQQELGDLVGVSKVSISGYESGNRIPSLEILIEIANYFNISLDYLVGREIKAYNEDDNRFVGCIAEPDIEIINEIKHYPILYNNILKNISKAVKNMSKRIK